MEDAHLQEIDHHEAVPALVRAHQLQYRKGSVERPEHHDTIDAPFADCPVQVLVAELELVDQ
jgi:hypothetical protein